MNRKNKKIIEEIFKYVGSDSILVIDEKGQLKRLYCPFMVKVIRGPFIEGRSNKGCYCGQNSS